MKYPNFVNLSGKGIPEKLKNEIGIFMDSSEQSVILSESLMVTIVYREGTNEMGGPTSILDFTSIVHSSGLYRVWAHLKIDWNRKVGAIYCRDTHDLADLMDASNIVASALYERGIDTVVQPLRLYEQYILGSRYAMLNEKYETCDINGKVYEPLMNG